MTALELIARTTAILTVAWFAARLMRRAPATAGAAIWTAALSCVLILPIMSRLLPPLRIELLPARSAVLPTTQMPAAAVRVESRQLETAARASGILPEGEASSTSAEHPLAWETILAGIWISVATALLLRTL